MNSRRKGWLAPIVLCGLALPAAPAGLHAQDWQLLGTRQVSYAAEKDVIPVTVRDGLFRSIKIEVADGNIEMYDVNVVFANGETFSPKTRMSFGEGSRSRVIDLPSTLRIINRIEFFYRSRIARGRATVRVYGLRGAPDRAEDRGEGRAKAQGQGRQDDHRDDAGNADRYRGWTPIGTRTVNFRIDHDVIPAAGEGRFRQVLVAVEGGDLEMIDVKFVFGDGATWSPNTRVNFKENSRSRVFDLPGATRVIRRIEFTYRSVPGGGQGRAEVKVFGRR